MGSLKNLSGFKSGNPFTIGKEIPQLNRGSAAIGVVAVSDLIALQLGGGREDCPDSRVLIYWHDTCAQSTVVAVDHFETRQNRRGLNKSSSLSHGTKRGRITEACVFFWLPSNHGPQNETRDAGMGCLVRLLHLLYTQCISANLRGFPKPER